MLSARRSPLLGDLHCVLTLCCEEFSSRKFEEGSQGKFNWNKFSIDLTLERGLTGLEVRDIGFCGFRELVNGIKIGLSCIVMPLVRPDTNAVER